MPNHGGQALDNFLEFFLGILHFCISVTFLKKKVKIIYYYSFYYD